MNGGAGFDTASYFDDGGSQGINANLITNSVTDSYGNTDMLTSIEGIIGTDFDDNFTVATRDSANVFTPYFRRVFFICMI